MPYRTPGQMRKEKEPTFLDSLKMIHLTKGAVRKVVLSAKLTKQKEKEEKRNAREAEKEEKKKAKKNAKKTKKLLKVAMKAVVGGAANGECYTSINVDKYTYVVTKEVTRLLEEEELTVTHSKFMRPEYIIIRWCEGSCG